MSAWSFEIEWVHGISSAAAQFGTGSAISSATLNTNRHDYHYNSVDIKLEVQVDHVLDIAGQTWGSQRSIYFQRKKVMPDILDI